MIRNARLWLGLVRFQKRQQALPRLVQARHDKAERERIRAFHSPPMTPEEVAEFEAAKARQRERDEAKRD